jgi:FAD/FMN-containing dehydrogenase
MPHNRIDQSVLRSLRQQMGDHVLARGDAGYDEARRIWNGRFDKRPGAIVRCQDAADVKKAVEFVRAADVLFAVKSGGHDYAGNSTCDDGLVIDLSRMNDVAVDADARIARVGPGARWAEIDRETQAFGLATTGGTVSSVGVAGFTLGGGTGHLKSLREAGRSPKSSRKASVTCFASTKSSTNWVSGSSSALIGCDTQAKTAKRT